MDDPRQLLAGLALPPLDEVLGASFRREHGLDSASQYGIAVRDVPDAVAEAEAGGAGPFVRACIVAPRWVERGVRTRARLDFALGYRDATQVEFLGPGIGTRFYSDTLGSNSAVLHHVGVYQSGLRVLEARLNRAGFPSVVTGGVRLGSLARFEFTYFDTRAALGVYLEILDFAVLGERPVPMRGLVEIAARFGGRRRSSRAHGPLRG